MTDTHPQQPDRGDPAPGARAGSAPSMGTPQVPPVQDLQVEPDRVREVATVIAEQADALQRKLAHHLDALQIPIPSEDIVSTHAVDGWNEVLTGGRESYEQRVQSYVQQLHLLAEQLWEAGADYAATEDDHAAALANQPGPGN